MTRAAIVGRLRKAFAHFEDGAHEAPAPGIVEIAEMPQEAAEGQPAIGLDHLDLARGGTADALRPRPLPARSPHCRRPMRRRRSRRRACRASAVEIDRRRRRMRRSARRQMAQRLRDRPVAHALLPRRQHDLARIKRLDAVGRLHRRREQAICRRRDLETARSRCAPATPTCAGTTADIPPNARAGSGPASASSPRRSAPRARTGRSGSGYRDRDR